MKLSVENLRILCIFFCLPSFKKTNNVFISVQIRFVRIDGSTSSYHRQELAQRFNENPDCKAAVLSIMAANAGLNMASASCVLFAEIMWNPGIMVQAGGNWWKGQNQCFVLFDVPLFKGVNLFQPKFYGKGLLLSLTNVSSFSFFESKSHHQSFPLLRGSCSSYRSTRFSPRAVSVGRWDIRRSCLGHAGAKTQRFGPSRSCLRLRWKLSRRGQRIPTSGEATADFDFDSFCSFLSATCSSSSSSFSSSFFCSPLWIVYGHFFASSSSS